MKRLARQRVYFNRKHTFQRMLSVICRATNTSAGGLQSPLRSVPKRACTQIILIQSTTVVIRCESGPKWKLFQPWTSKEETTEIRAQNAWAHTPKSPVTFTCLWQTNFVGVQLVHNLATFHIRRSSKTLQNLHFFVCLGRLRCLPAQVYFKLSGSTLGEEKILEHIS